jgi:hypothetical protein
VTYWLDKNYDDWCADPGYQLFFPEIFFKDDHALCSLFGNDLEGWGCIFRFNTFAELRGDHHFMATELPHFFIRSRKFNKPGYRDLLMRGMVEPAWNRYLGYLMDRKPELFPKLRFPRARMYKKNFDPLFNEDVSCLFSNLRWPLEVITGDWKLGQDERYSFPAVKPCNRLHAEGNGDSSPLA